MADTDSRIDPEVVGPQKVGGRYLCGYWKRAYTVTDIRYIQDWRGTSITCLWEDGHTTTHSTPWDSQRDTVLFQATVDPEVTK